MATEPRAAHDRYPLDLDDGTSADPVAHAQGGFPMPRAKPAASASRAAPQAAPTADITAPATAPIPADPAPPVFAPVVTTWGEELDGELFAPVMLTLKMLLASHPLALHELVMLARYPGHPLFGTARKVLSEQSLLDENGVLDGRVAAIVRASLQGDGTHMRLIHPVREMQDGSLPPPTTGPAISAG